ncbi:MAG: transposase family protein [Nitrospirota bacterium]
MVNIDKILNNKRLTLALTGLTPQEFTDLLPLFDKVWQDKKQYDYKKHRHQRSRKPGGGRKGFLRTTRDKLFFILLYYKCYPTYDVLTLLYGFNRANGFRRQEQLTGILEKTLGRKMSLPERRLKRLEEFFEMFPEAREVFLDGTERPIQRPKDPKKQKDKYSGKKKRHTVKNIIIADKHKRIGFLSKTESGRKHDFDMLKEHAPPKYIPITVKQHMDLGFKGYHAQFPDHSISIPDKKPRTRELCKAKRRQNRKKSGWRVLVEHAIGGVKRFRITTDVFRNKLKGADDKAMLISCGLWNYHLQMS